MTRNAEMIDTLDALSRTRALTMAESIRLEKLLKAEGLIPEPVGPACINGHIIAGDNARKKSGSGQVVCRECDRAAKRFYYQRSLARVKAIGNIEARGAA